uniref:SH3 domain-containing protein n=1 Tax=Hucho hucho TaxID=62062 RepID=A0A4W5M8P9_9TELE
MASGDIIILRQKVDENWYYGDTNSSSGLVAANMIQIIDQQHQTPPQCQSQFQKQARSQTQPQFQSQPLALCKALYDFDSKEMDVDLDDCKDCLTFHKGDVLTVIRRADENWIEGKLGDKVGIFPVHFTEVSPLYSFYPSIV